MVEGVFKLEYVGLQIEILNVYAIGGSVNDLVD